MWYFLEFAEFVFEFMNLHLVATKRHVILITDWEKVARITEEVQD
jgi:hypothetical protein